MVVGYEETDINLVIEGSNAVVVAGDFTITVGKRIQGEVWLAG